jgi:hypothetical protein
MTTSRRDHLNDGVAIELDHKGTQLSFMYCFPSSLII